MDKTRFLSKEKRTLTTVKVRKYVGAPGGTRTPDLLVRSQSLYPAELQAHLPDDDINYSTPYGKCQHFF